MNKFLFLTRVTPKDKQTEMRRQLQKLYLKALRNQTYSDWFVFLFGEWLPEAEGDPRFKLLNKFNDLLSPDSLDFVMEFDYIIRLDDDDIINPFVLEKLKDFRGDVYCDRYYTLIEVSTGMICQNVVRWMPPTSVHKVKHALSIVDGKPLIAHEHTQWIDYYKGNGLGVVYAPREEPLYLRVIHPFSWSSGIFCDFASFISDREKVMKYIKYVMAFSDSWKVKVFPQFNDYYVELEKIWKELSGFDWSSSPLRHDFKLGTMKKMKKKIVQTIKKFARLLLKKEVCMLFCLSFMYKSFV